MVVPGLAGVIPAGATPGAVEAAGANATAAAVPTAGSGLAPDWFADAVMSRLATMADVTFNPMTGVTFAQLESMISSWADGQGAAYPGTGTYVDPGTGREYFDPSVLLEQASGMSSWLPGTAGTRALERQIEESLQALSWRIADNQSYDYGLEKMAVGKTTDGCNKGPSTTPAGLPTPGLLATFSSTYQQAEGQAVQTGISLGVSAAWFSVDDDMTVKLGRSFVVFSPVNPNQVPGPRRYATLPLPGVPIDAARVTMITSTGQPLSSESGVGTVTVSGRDVPAGAQVGTADWDLPGGVVIGSVSPGADGVVPSPQHVPLPLSLLMAPGSTVAAPQFRPGIEISLTGEEPPPGFPDDVTCDGYSSSGALYIATMDAGFGGDGYTLLYHEDFPPISPTTCPYTPEAGIGVSTGASAEDVPGWVADDVTENDIDALVQALQKNAHLYLAEKRDKALEADTQRAEALIASLKTIAELELNKSANPGPEQKTVDAVNVVVGLLGSLFNEKWEGSSDLAARAQDIIKLAAGKSSEKGRKKILTDNLKELAKRFAKSAGVTDAQVAAKFGELTGQISTLYDLVFGTLSDEERSDAFKQAVKGLLERTVFSGWLTPAYLKAATTGYELGSSIGTYITNNLASLTNQRLKEAVICALNTAGVQKGHENWFQDLHSDTSFTSLMATVDFPKEYEGWTAEAFYENNVVYVQVLGKPLGIIDLILGKHPDEYLVQATDLPGCC